MGNKQRREVVGGTKGVGRTHKHSNVDQEPPEMHRLYKRFISLICQITRRAVEMKRS